MTYLVDLSSGYCFISWTYCDFSLICVVCMYFVRCFGIVLYVRKVHVYLVRGPIFYIPDFLLEFFTFSNFIMFHMRYLCYLTTICSYRFSFDLLSVNTLLICRDNLLAILILFFFCVSLDLVWMSPYFTFVLYGIEYLTPFHLRASF